MLYCVEYLNTIAWFFHVLPYFVKARMHGSDEPLQLFYIDATRIGLCFANSTKGLVCVRIERLVFRLIDVRDERGLMVRLRIAYDDLARAQKTIIDNALFQETLLNEAVQGRMRTFLAKQVVHASLTSDESLFRPLLLTQILAWKKRNSARAVDTCVLFLERRLWMGELKKYAASFGITLKEVTPGVRFNRRIISIRFPWIKNIYEYIKSRNMKRIESDAPHLGIVVEYRGQLNLEKQELHSDISFFGQSGLLGSDILLTFNSPADPLDHKKWSILKKYGIRVVVLHPQAATVSSVPRFTYWRKVTPLSFPYTKSQNAERRWLQKKIQEYYRERAYWVDLFLKSGSKIYMTWYKYSADHCVIADAMESVGGVTAIYQRAFEEFPCPETTIAADIVFGFSKQGAELERRSNSVIPYYVITGYLGDYRFPLLQTQAKEMRAKMHRCGAKHIIAFFDENSRDDARWYADHETMRGNYSFLLEKVLSDSSLGVLFKPKVPSTIRQRLGERLAVRLKQAEATGRCYIFEDGVMHGSYPPAVAALASDLAIHGHLCAATAGVESALAGAPTLLLDREGWSISSFYRLFEKKKVVFTNWNDIWDACAEHWDTQGGVPGFGDWSATIDTFDPFHDGRATERMGTYLRWLLEGFKARRPRQEVLTDAADRYKSAWGDDKVISIHQQVC